MKCNDLKFETRFTYLLQVINNQNKTITWFDPLKITPPPQDIMKLIRYAIKKTHSFIHYNSSVLWKKNYVLLKFTLLIINLLIFLVIVSLID